MSILRVYFRSKREKLSGCRHSQPFLFASFFVSIQT